MLAPLQCTCAMCDPHPDVRCLCKGIQPWSLIAYKGESAILLASVGLSNLPLTVYAVPFLSPPAWTRTSSSSMHQSEPAVKSSQTQSLAATLSECGTDAKRRVGLKAQAPNCSRSKRSRSAASSSSHHCLCTPPASAAFHAFDAARARFAALSSGGGGNMSW